MSGTPEGHRACVLVDGGRDHNFIAVHDIALMSLDPVPDNVIELGVIRDADADLHHADTAKETSTWRATRPSSS